MSAVQFECFCGEEFDALAWLLAHREVAHPEPAPVPFSGCGLCDRGDERRRVKNRRTGKLISGWYHVSHGEPIRCGLELKS